MERIYRRFEILDKEKLDEFEKLCDEKKLNRKDLILILKTIALSSDFDILEPESRED